MTIPNSVKSIEERAFSLTRNLTTVISEILEPFELSGVFEYSPQDTLYVPIGTRDLYRQTWGWSHFKNILELGVPDLKPLELAASEASLESSGDSYKIEITSGNGDYTVTSSNDQVATASIKTEEEKDWLVIVPHNAGEATITVTDNASDQQQTVTVKVSQVTKGECLTFMVNGSPVDIVLSEHPIITYTNNTLHVKTAAKTVDIPVKDISGGKLNTK